MNSKGLRRIIIKNKTENKIRLRFTHELGKAFHIYVKSKDNRTPLTPIRIHKRIKEQVVDELTSGEDQQRQNTQDSLTVEFHDRKQLTDLVLSPKAYLSLDDEFDGLVDKYKTVYLYIIIVYSSNCNIRYTFNYELG